MRPQAQSTEEQSRPPQGKHKVPTRISGLDNILAGGVPKGALTLLRGGPGTGKTMLGLEFVYRSALAGRPGVFLSFEERETALRRYANNLGWDLESLEEQGLLILIGAHLNPDAIFSGDFDLRGILAILENKIAASGAREIVIDAPDVFLRLLDHTAKERVELHMLNEWLRNRDLTALMTVKGGDNGRFPSQYNFLDYMADCVIRLDQRTYEQVATRRLQVLKYRGSSFGQNEYPFGITPSGFRIIPITQANLQHRGLGEPVSSGISALDTLLEGGYRRASCTLLTGGSGTGKTTFACSFARSATAQGERVLYLDFEESWEALTATMQSPGINLQGALDSGLLHFISSLPESQGIEDHLIQAFAAIEEFQPDFLIVDAISACRRMGADQSAFDYLLRLIDICKQRGITTLLTNLTANSAEEDEITGIDLSSVIDTVLILRNRECAGTMQRELVILKSRGRNHSMRVHNFAITSQGIGLSVQGAQPHDV